MKLIIVPLVAILALVQSLPTPNLKSGIQELTPENAFKLKHLTKADNVEEYSGQFEGDIVLTPAQLQSLMSRNGLIGKTYRWINNTVPYVIKDDHFSYEHVQYIRRALDQLELTTCLKFVEWSGENDYIEVAGDPLGCWSYVGRLSGKQELNLEVYAIESGCFRLATIMHEFMHALGFYHMQSTHDRDDYVEIKWDNIWPGAELNFDKYESDIVSDFDIKYDYSSVMHYGSDGFSSNGEPTIVTNDPAYQHVIGQRVGLSRRDIEKMNRMYECPM